jgi:predicted alpha/beta superfamily hydrolase
MTVLRVFTSLFLICLLSSCTNRPALNVSGGKIVQIVDFPSAYIDARTITIWLPEDYNKSAKHPVLYMHDGQMLFDASKTWNGQEWGVDEVLTSLRNEIKPLPIVVGIWNNPVTRHADFTPQKALTQYASPLLDSLVMHANRGNEKLFNQPPRADAYLKFLVNEVKPHIDKTFNTNPEVSHTFIAGSSMGGLISLYALLEYPNTFGGAACLSTHWPVTFFLENNPFPKAITQYIHDNRLKLANKKLYMDYGTETLDSLYEIPQKGVAAILEKDSINRLRWESKKFEGAAHTEQDWQNRLEIPVKFLLNN